MLVLHQGIPSVEGKFHVEQAPYFVAQSIGFFAFDPFRGRISSFRCLCGRTHKRLMWL
jgi:hypothetical protein